MSQAPARIFLAASSSAARPEPAEGEAEHLLRVLRLEVGAAVIGLDGRGGSYPLRIAEAGRRACRLEADGGACFDPPPGAPDAPLPWIEIAVAWPKPNRAEEMLDRLTQLGVSAIRPLDCAQSGPHGLPDDGQKRERCLRVLREACKQSRRTWLPELLVSETIAAFAPRVSGARLAVLDPQAERGLGEWIAEVPALRDANRERPLVLCVGPEGGFSSEERAALVAAGAAPVRLGPHILRIETAAEAAAAVASTLLRRG
jgi:16S rRNA (uracil1498-N3)-methyltransferase